jgi:hypothetical protein
VDKVMNLCAALAEPAIKESLTVAEPEQELMGYEHHEYRTYGAPGEIRIHAVLKSQYLHPDGSIGGDFQWLIDSYKTEKTTIKLIPLYTAQPRREWVGLKDDEISAIVREAAKNSAIRRDGSTSVRIARAIESRLREKNGG